MPMPTPSPFRPQAALPLLDPKATARWWGENRGRFDPRRRYLAGALLSRVSLGAALPALSMRRRRWVLFGQALLSRGRWLPSAARFSAEQRRQESRLPELGGFFA